MLLLSTQVIGSISLLVLAGAGFGLAASGRLLGGSDADVGAYPYTVSLQLAASGTHRCGGVIINNRFVLTAAHCVTVGSGIEPYPAQRFQVRAGSIQRLVGGQVVFVKRIIVHGEYRNGLNNLALLELQTPLTFNANTQAIALADQAPADGSVIVVTGWGATYTQGSTQQRLKGSTLQTISGAECEKYLYLLHDGLLCAVQHAENGEEQGLCAGDAGSPAVLDNKLVGIGSFYVGACGTSMPDGFVNIFNYRDWITANSA
ncbi:serine protease SP24D [Scaptodrosophila lebanonensis]|uniref:trypsin n=1 Tax=Drosophila lebanonensis TaxID=7225 RepID=A0A6J2U1V9_DROLE|nr:serine protease SP24D [Scaptodrosophila lebanonensis]